MTKGRKTTEKELAEIVAFCIEHGKNYPLTIKTYGVSYQQIYAWVKKKGVQGLVDGNRKGDRSRSVCFKHNQKTRRWRSLC